MINKVLSIMLCLLALMCMLSAPAEENPFELPNEFGFTTADGGQESIEIVINGRNTPLAFDGSSEFSSVVDGTVQASFYAYSENSDYLYELYMLFPESVQSGSVINPDYALKNHPDCSVILIVSNKEKEQYFYAGQVDGRIYPSDAGYTMSFETVTGSEIARTYTGKLSASLAAMDPNSGTPLVSFKIENAPFSFTMKREQDEDENPFSDFPDEPAETFDPGAFESLPTSTPEAYRI